jgi:hypothetical protein
MFRESLAGKVEGFRGKGEVFSPETRFAPCNPSAVLCANSALNPFFIDDLLSPDDRPASFLRRYSADFFVVALRNNGLI